MNQRQIYSILLALAFVFVMVGAAQEKSADTAIDPVCGMTVKKAEAKATYDYKGTTYYFCNPGCKESFAKDPEKFLAKKDAGAPTGMMRHGMSGDCPMMKAKMAEGCCGKMAGRGMMGKGCCGMMGQKMMGQGMMAGGGCQGCPMMGKDVERKVENTADGVTVKISSKNPETVKKIQEHVAACQKMCQGMAEKAAPKEEKK